MWQSSGTLSLHSAPVPTTPSSFTLILLCSLLCLALMHIWVFNPWSSGVSHKAKPDRSYDTVTKLALGAICKNRVVFNFKNSKFSSTYRTSLHHKQNVKVTGTSFSHFSSWKGKVKAVFPLGRGDILPRRHGTEGRWSCGPVSWWLRGRQSGGSHSCWAPAVITTSHQSPE